MAAMVAAIDGDALSVQGTGTTSSISTYGDYKNPIDLTIQVAARVLAGELQRADYKATEYVHAGPLLQTMTGVGRSPENKTHRPFLSNLKVVFQLCADVLEVQGNRRLLPVGEPFAERKPFVRAFLYGAEKIRDVDVGFVGPIGP